MENRFIEYIGFMWRDICLCVKILIVVVVLFVLLQAAEVVSLYINVNSGGLEPVFGEIFLYCFFGTMALFLLFVILIPTCFIVSLIKISEPINILVTFIAVAIAAASFKGTFYLRNEKIQHNDEPDSVRCVGYNTAKSKKLREFGLELGQLKNDTDFTFTEQFLEPNATNYMLFPINGRCVLNSNLLHKKPSQLSNNVVVIFESNIPHDKGYIGGPNDISTWWHYGRGSLMVFGDGRVEFVKTEDFDNLQWKP